MATKYRVNNGWAIASAITFTGDRGAGNIVYTHGTSLGIGQTIYYASTPGSTPLLVGVVNGTVTLGQAYTINPTGTVTLFTGKPCYAATMTTSPVAVDNLIVDANSAISTATVSFTSFTCNTYTVSGAPIGGDATTFTVAGALAINAAAPNLFSTIILGNSAAAVTISMTGYTDTGSLTLTIGQDSGSGASWVVNALTDIYCNILYIAQGVFSAGIYNIHATNVFTYSGRTSASAVSGTINMGSGTWYTGWFELIYSPQIGIILNPQTATLITTNSLAYVGSTTAPVIMNAVIFDMSGLGAGTIYGNITCSSFTLIPSTTGPTYLSIGSGVGAPTVFTSATMAVNGANDQSFIDIAPTITGDVATLIASGSAISMTYIHSHHINYSPANSWYANDSVDGGSNTGIFFNYGNFMRFF